MVAVVLCAGGVRGRGPGLCAGRLADLERRRDTCPMLRVLLAESDLHSVGVNLFSSAVALVLGLVGARAFMVISGRRLWRLSDPERVIVCVSESGAAETGKYRRPATGLIVRAGSPFRSGRSVVVLAGASTFGTTAAARFFVEHCRSVRGPFAAIVKARVRDRHALEPEKVVLARYHEKDGSWR